jgi:DNA-directed RNA polymerase specialized sigma24 family protein
MVADFSILISLAADGRLTRRDWQVIDAVHVRGLGIRAAARIIGVSHTAVRKRLAKVSALCRTKSFVSYSPA